MRDFDRLLWRGEKKANRFTGLPTFRSLYVGNMASSDVHVRLCEQEILKYDLEIKALIQVRTYICRDSDALDYNPVSVEHVNFNSK